jgi:Fe-S cluster assembly protein SufD
MTVTKEKEQEALYLKSFADVEKRLAQNSPSWVHEIRRASLEHFAELGFPSTHQEEWRFTNIGPIAATAFRTASAAPTASVVQSIQRLPMADLGCNRLTFVNGRYQPELSRLDAVPKGVRVGSLAEALRSDGGVLEAHLARYADYATHAFVALNTAFLEDGAFIEVPKGVVIEKPLHLLHISVAGGRPIVSHPRNLIVAGPTSQFTVIETFFGMNEEVYFTNSVTEIVAGEGALVDYYKVQQESDPAFHYARIQVQQDRASTVSTHSIALGSAISREEVQAVLNGEGAESLLQGLYVIGGRQLVDNHTTIDHARPHCNSREVYKGVLEDKAQGVFNGKIIVRPDAQKTDSKQSNKNLLLSEDATINTKPQLEIYADDVKCTHGATVGQIDPDAVFYLRSRGISVQDARSLLTFAFANDIMEQIKYEPLREQLRERLFARLANPQFIKEA